MAADPTNRVYVTGSRRAFLREGSVGAALLTIPMIPFAATAAAAPLTFTSRRIAVSVVGGSSQAAQDVLLIPGLASGPALWRGMLRALSAVPVRWHLITVRGFAGLPADLNASGPLLSPLADELVRYITSQRLHRPALIGHSMGGSLALMAALRASGRIGRLMVVDMLPDGAAMLGGTSAGLGYLARELNGYFTGTKAGRQLLADMVRQTPAGRDSDPRVISRALADLAQTDLADQLPRLACPLDVVYALPPDTRLRTPRTRQFRDAYSGAKSLRLTALGPASHMLVSEQPARFAQEVRKFLGL